MGLLYAKSHRISDDISVLIPTVGEVLDMQEDYNRVLTAFVCTPYELMVQLDDMGIDFTQINKYQLFFMLFRGVLEEYQSGNMAALDLVLTGCDFHHIHPAIDVDDQAFVFVDEKKHIVINNRIYQMIRATLCHLHDIENKEKRLFSNDDKDFFLERMRAKQRRLMRQNKQSTELEDYIVALVNAREFKYDFDSVRGLTLYQFHRSLKQILKRLNYDQIMQGYYAGNLDIGKISQDTLNWLSPK